MLVGHDMKQLKIMTIRSYLIAGISLLMLAACDDGDGASTENLQSENNAIAECVWDKSNGGDLKSNPLTCYQNGERHGQWIERYPWGSVYEGSMVNGKRQGRWVQRYPSKNVWEGEYVNGKAHGQWTIQYTNGAVGNVVYDNDKIISRKKR